MTRCCIAVLFATTGLLPGADLTFERLSLHQFEDGPAVAQGYQHLPGETAWLGARIDGFATEKISEDREDRRVKVSWKAQPLDPEGVPLVEPMNGEVEEVLLSQDKTWLPKVMAVFVIPPFAPAGTYRIAITAHDHIAGKDLSGELTFRVRGEPPVSADALGVRNFRYLVRETDRLGLQPAIYSPGDTLFAKFDIVGYKLAEKNRFEVEYGLAVFSGERQMFAQPDAAKDTGGGFYPQRWVPGGFSLNLTNDLKPGTYTVKVTVRDLIGGTVAEIAQPFEVR